MICYVSYPFITNPSHPFITNPSHPFITNPSHPFNTNQLHPFITNQSHPFITNPSHPFITNQSHLFITNPSHLFITNQPHPCITNQSNLFHYKPITSIHITCLSYQKTRWNKGSHSRPKSPSDGFGIVIESGSRGCTESLGFRRVSLDIYKPHCAVVCVLL